MSKHTKHNSWKSNECDCGLHASRHPEFLHEEYVELKGTILDLLQSLEAEDQLKNGFNGMGYNIMTETASKKRMHIRRLRGMIGEE